MGVLTLSCAHCGQLNVPFQSTMAWQAERETKRVVTDRMGRSRPERVSFWVAAFSCSRCQHGAIVEFAGAPNNPHSATEGALSANYKVAAVWPSISAPAAPADTPPNITNYFVQAEHNLAHRNWDAAGAMCRKALDVSIQDIDKKPSGGRIGPRIQELAAAGKITADMAEWAKIIWKDGSDASHDADEFTEQEAKRLASFTRVFLTYCFTLPKMVERYKAATSPPTAAAAANKR